MLAGLAVLLSLAGCAPSPEGPSVVIVLIDTVRADHVGAYGAGAHRTPVLDSLATEGVLFTECRTPYPLTLPATTSLLASQWPNVHEVRENFAERLTTDALTLAEVFRERGYRTGAFVSALPLRAETGCAQGFDVYDDDFSEPFPFYRPEFQPLSEKWTGSERRGDTTIARAIEWARDQDGPYFLFVHLFDAHSPYDPPPGFETPPSHYAGEVRFVDSLVGRLVRAVDEPENPPLVTVVADHGEGLGEHEEWAHGIFLYDTTLHVPWILSWREHLTARRVEALTSLVDVAPTLLACLGWPVPPSWVGRDALSASAVGGVYAENHFTRIEYGWSPTEAWITPEWKWIRSPKPELYDRHEDPDELRNLVEGNPSVAAHMRAALDTFHVRTHQAAGAHGIASLVATIQPEARVRDWLTNLGYIAGDRSAPDSARLPDPKDEIEAWNRTNDAATHASRGEEALRMRNVPLAIAAFEASLSYKRTPDALSGLGRAYVYLGRFDAARPLLEACLDARPRDVEALMAYAIVLEAADRAAAADSALWRATLIDSTEITAWGQRAALALRRDRVRDALRYYERVIALDPADETVAEAAATLYLEQGEAARAAELLAGLVAARDWDPVLWLSLGRAEVARGRPKEARRAFEAARERVGRGALRDTIDAALDALR